MAKAVALMLMSDNMVKVSFHQRKRPLVKAMGQGSVASAGPNIIGC